MGEGTTLQHRPAQLLATVLVGDAVFDSAAKRWVEDDLARLRVPQSAIGVIVTAKVAAAVGLLAGVRRRPLGLLTSACLVLYFVLAVGAHVRAHDEAWRYLPAIGMLAWCLTVFRAFRTPGAEEEEVLL